MAFLFERFNKFNNCVTSIMILPLCLAQGYIYCSSRGPHNVVPSPCPWFTPPQVLSSIPHRLSDSISFDQDSESISCKRKRVPHVDLDIQLILPSLWHISTSWGWSYVVCCLPWISRWTQYSLRINFDVSNSITSTSCDSPPPTGISQIGEILIIPPSSPPLRPSL